MIECTLPTYQEAPLRRHIDVKQSQSWCWVHQPQEELTLSPRAKARLSWLRWHADHGENVSLTCRHFALSRPTFYRWCDRYRARGLRGLEDRSRRPHRLTPPTWTTAQAIAVRELREAYPYMGKRKLHVLLCRQGIHLSISMVGRILRRLRLSGQLTEPPRLRRRRGLSHYRPHAIRKPRGHPITAPGDVVQLDTLDVLVTPGTRVLQLSLVDMVSRWALAEVRFGKTARTMRESLSRMRERLPFPIRALQIDGGSEFKAEFETYCQEQGIALFVLPPRSPKLNGQVERLQRTFRDECYACVDMDPKLAAVQEAVQVYEDTYNTIRPHQALGYLTPREYLDAQKEIA